MAQIINLNMKRQKPSGIVCNSVRPIVIWGDLPAGFVEALEEELNSIRQLYCQPPEVKDQSEIIREACDKLVPDHWDFALQGGTIEF